jgi:protein O-GlcNAc transferase
VVVYSAVVKADAKTHRFRERVLKKGGLWRDIYGIDEKKACSSTGYMDWLSKYNGFADH